MILALAAIALAVSAEAASVNWKFSATGAFEGYNVYLTKTAGTFADITAIEKDLIGTGASAELIASSRSSAASGSITGLMAETKYDFFYVAVKGNDYWVSSAQSVTTGAESAGAASANFSAANGASLIKGTPTGSFSSAPEPTSGLLLLLGMAGLALKRKVA